MHFPHIFKNKLKKTINRSKTAQAHQRWKSPSPASPVATLRSASPTARSTPPTSSTTPSSAASRTGRRTGRPTQSPTEGRQSCRRSDMWWVRTWDQHLSASSISTPASWANWAATATTVLGYSKIATIKSSYIASSRFNTIAKKPWN